jgi:RNA polymerase sigma-70 factor (ECF subfamily)
VDEDDLQALATRAAAGDGAAFTAFVRATQADIRRLCAGLVDQNSADDLAQETYLRAHRALANYDGRAPVQVWLAGIARNVCRSEWRTRLRRRRLHRRLDDQPAATDPIALVDIRYCIRALSSERREAFVLTQMLGFSYDETADICRCPVGTIRSRVARARDDLRTALTDRQAVSRQL